MGQNYEHKHKKKHREISFYKKQCFYLCNTVEK